MTPCNEEQLRFPGVGRRSVVADFDAGDVTTDAGALLLGVAARGLGLFGLAADCVGDHRDPELVEHSVEELIAQRVLALCAGYEDLNDHATLRDDVAFAAAVGKADPTGQDRGRSDHRGTALASPATLNRLENAPLELDSKRADLKLVHDTDAWKALFVDLFLDQTEETPEEIWLDLDATDIPLHGAQEGRFFHGYYDCYCYLPLYIFCGHHLLVAKQRRSNIDAAAGALEEVQRLVDHIRGRWPEVRIVLRADSGFARDELMTWCERQTGVDYLFGLARNSRLEGEAKPLFEEIECRADEDEPPRRLYDEFEYRTKKSWSRSRRVVVKAEMLGEKKNPRFLVTSLSPEWADAQTLYRDHYCPRGDAENRIKEQFELFADRASAHSMRANQVRLWLSSLAYVLMQAVRRIGLAGTDMENAQPKSIRLRLLKLGALVTVSVRRVRLRLSSTFPRQTLFRQVLANLYGHFPFLAPG